MSKKLKMIFRLLQHKKCNKFPSRSHCLQTVHENQPVIISHNIILHLEKNKSLYIQSIHATHTTVNVKVKVQFQHYFSIPYIHLGKILGEMVTIFLRIFYWGMKINFLHVQHCYVSFIASHAKFYSHRT